MNDVALLNRTDTKYVVRTAQLYPVLATLTEHYQVLEVAQVRLSPYQTLYFDTADFALFLRHQAGARNRYKVRSRQYVNTGQSFFEVKHKTNTERTIKHRIETEEFVTNPSEHGALLAAHVPLDPRHLEPKLWNRFSRITLVSKQRNERLTLDLDLRFGNRDQQMALDGIAVAEVKQQGIDRGSIFIQQMRARQIHPMAFSKYCMGVSMLYSDVKHNNFKPKLRLIQKLTGGNHDER